MSFPPSSIPDYTMTEEADNSGQITDEQDKVEDSESALMLGSSSGLADDQVMMRSWMLRKLEKGLVLTELEGLREV